MYTPGFSNLRKANKDFKVPNSNHVIKNDSVVWIPTIGIHFDDRFYPNPTEFNPENFTQEAIAGRPQQTYFPFGDGPRNCIGMR